MSDEPKLVAYTHRHGYARRSWALSCSLCGPLVARRRSVEDVVPIARAHVRHHHAGRGRFVNADAALPTSTRRS